MTEPNLQTQVGVDAHSKDVFQELVQVFCKCFPEYTPTQMQAVTYVCQTTTSINASQVLASGF